MNPPPDDGSDPVPPPPPGGEAGPGVVTPDPHLEGQETTLQRYKRNFWARLGGQGLAISLLIHLFALLIFGFWVVSVVTDTARKEPDSFATGSGGGAAGDLAKIYEHKVTPKNARNLAKSTARITSKSTTSSLALPELPATSVSSMTSGLVAGGASKGFGGGSGGGIGSGKGVGVGNGRNFVGRPVMGAKIFASRIAVYLDASGSMRGYLPRVEAEIRKQFPEADIYRYNGAWTVVDDGEIVGGRRSKGKEGVGPPQDPSSFTTDAKTLTADGKNIYRKYDDNFRRGSVGAWIDVMCKEKYDALIIFSDFQDGVDQYRKGEMIYADGSRQQINTRKKTDERWEGEWLATFGRGRDGGGPKLYCFSTEVEPQPLLSQCIKASGGETKMVTWLRDPNAQRPPDPTDPQGQPAQTVVPASPNQGYRPPR